MTSSEGFTKESIILAIAPKVPALLSWGGSLYIVWSVLSSREKKSSIYHRLMLGLSCSDILSSHIYFLGTWLIPKGSSGPFGDVFMAFGTNATCSYSGFFNQLAVASPLYNVSLSVYYMLHIQRGWRENALKKVEPLFHIIPLVFAAITAMTAAIGEMYGNVFWTCWINPDPPQPYFRYFQWSFLFAPVWICIMIQLCVMTTLWWTMRKQERLVSRKYALEEPTTTTSSGLHVRDGTDSQSGFTKDVDEESRVSSTILSHDGSSSKSGKAKSNARRKRTTTTRRSSINNEGKYSSRIAVQGSLYVLAFCICWFFPTVQRITELANGTNYFAIQALDTTLLPLQGFFNVLIYLRPRYMTYRRKYPDLPTMTIFKIIQRPNKENSLVHQFRENKMAAAAAAAAAAIQREEGKNNSQGGGVGDDRSSISSTSEQQNNNDILSCIPEEAMESGSSSLVHVSVSFSVKHQQGSSKKLSSMEESSSDNDAATKQVGKGTTIDRIHVITSVETASSSSNVTDNKKEEESSAIIMRIDMGGRIHSSSVETSSSPPERESTDIDDDLESL